ncbi:MAG: class GN sortase [Pseudomonadota bacterium]
MPTAPLHHQAEGRGSMKGDVCKAPIRALRTHLPLLIIAALLLSGAAMTAKALYIPIKAEVAQVLLARAFDQSVEQGRPIKPWNWADTAPVARIAIPRLGVSEIVLSGGSGEAMAFGPTQVLNDPARGISILSAHRDTHFEFIRDLEVGDEIELERIDGSLAHFRVTRFETVRWDAFTYVSSDENHTQLALATCWPFGTHVSGPLRRVAWTEEI